MLELFKAILYTTIVNSLAFLEPALAEKLAICAHTTRIEVGGFLFEAAQNF